MVPLLCAICPINSDQVKIGFATQENNHKVLFPYLSCLDRHSLIYILFILYLFFPFVLFSVGR